MSVKSSLKKAPNYYSESFKRELIEYYLSNPYTKRDVWRKFTGYDREHGQIIVWMRKLGYVDEEFINRSKFTSSNLENIMKEKDVNRLNNSNNDKRINELKSQLEEAELKAIAYSKMIDIAEEKFKIAIRKKLNTKL